jgi:hypothetical protein
MVHLLHMLILVSFTSKEEAETSLDLAMKMLGMQMNTAPTVH